jgi:hypothetical protein
MKITHIAVARNIKTDRVHKMKIALIEGYTTEADIPAIVETNLGAPVEIIQIVPAEELDPLTVATFGA